MRRPFSHRATVSRWTEPGRQAATSACVIPALTLIALRIAGSGRALAARILQATASGTFMVPLRQGVRTS